MPCVGGPTIHFMLGKTWERECVGGYGMMCVMGVLDEYEPKEATSGPTRLGGPLKVSRVLL